MADGVENSCGVHELERAVLVGLQQDKATIWLGSWRRDGWGRRGTGLFSEPLWRPMSSSVYVFRLIWRWWWYKLHKRATFWEFNWWEPSQCSPLRFSWFDVFNSRAYIFSDICALSTEAVVAPSPPKPAVVKAPKAPKVNQKVRQLFFFIFFRWQSSRSCSAHPNTLSF